MKTGEQVIRAERSVLAAMMLDASAIEKAANILRPEDFHHIAHGLVFGGLSALGQPDLPSLAVAMDQGGNLARVGGPAFLASLLDEATTSANVEAHARIVLEASKNRARLDSARKIVQSLESGEDERAELYSGQLQAMFAPPPVKNSIAEAILAVTPPAMEMPLACLYGLKIRPGSLTAVAARPGVGKSAMLMAMALHASQNGWNTLFISLEMPAEDVWRRLVAMESGVTLDEVYNPGDSAAEIVRSLGRVTNLPLTVVDMSERLSALPALLRRASAFASEKSVVFVDYLQLVDGQVRTEKRYEALGNVCRQLKLLALSKKIPVVVAAQVGRGAEQHSSGKPQLSDLRESGDIEATCDNVLLMHEEGSQFMLRVGKQRQGPKFHKSCMFDAARCRFTDTPENGGWQ